MDEGSYLQAYELCRETMTTHWVAFGLAVAALWTHFVWRDMRSSKLQEKSSKDQEQISKKLDQILNQMGGQSAD